MEWCNVIINNYSKRKGRIEKNLAFFVKINQIWYPGKVTISELLGQKRKADILFVHGVKKEETKGSFRGWQEYHT